MPVEGEAKIGLVHQRYLKNSVPVGSYLLEPTLNITPAKSGQVPSKEMLGMGGGGVRIRPQCGGDGASSQRKALLIWALRGWQE